MGTGTDAFEILLTEDNAADAELVHVALREHRVPCKLHVVRDGAKAIELLDRLDNDARE
jgi:CheY-like chemotaxis protein